MITLTSEQQQKYDSRIKLLVQEANNIAMTRMKARLLEPDFREQVWQIVADEAPEQGRNTVIEGVFYTLACAFMHDLEILMRTRGLELIGRTYEEAQGGAPASR